jgi:hypothetical protein
MFYHPFFRGLVDQAETEKRLVDQAETEKG